MLCYVIRDDIGEKWTVTGNVYRILYETKSAAYFFFFTYLSPIRAYSEKNHPPHILPSLLHTSLLDQQTTTVLSILMLCRFHPQFVGFRFLRYSPMTQPINDFMPRVVDSGIIEHLLDMWSPYRSMKDQVKFSLQGMDHTSTVQRVSSI